MNGFFQKKKKLILSLVVLLVLAGTGVWWFYFRSAATTDTQTATAKVRKGKIEVTVSANGAVQPASIRNVTANVGGAIKSINIKNGQQVKLGDLLFTLDDSSLQAQITRALLSQKQTRMDISTTNEELGQQRVTAPAGGQVTALTITEGQDVQKNSVLMTIQDSTKLTFEAPFNSGQIKYIQVGQKADVTIADLYGEKAKGTILRVDRVGRIGTDGSRMYYVKISIPNPGTLTAGLKVNAVVSTSNGLQYSYDLTPLELPDAVSVRAGVSGTVQKLYIDENNTVKKGQVLATTSSDSLSNQMDSQQISLQESNLSIAELRKQLADYKVYAPFTGIITMTPSQSSSSSSSESSSSSSSSGATEWMIGEEVNKGRLLATIEGSGGMVVIVPVDEVDIAKVKVGQKANITVDALPDQNFTGVVSEIGDIGTVQNSVASFDVTVTIEKPVGIKLGMTANAVVMVNQKDNVLTVPIEAVQERQGKKFVTLASGASSGGSSGSSTPAGRRNLGDSASTGNTSGKQPQGNSIPVETGLYNETIIEITGGLKEGDTVVLPAVVRSTGTSNNRGPLGGGGGGGGGFDMH
jgi:HlyD family secretion protein